MRTMLLLVSTGCAVGDRYLLDVPIYAGGVEGDAITLTEASVTFADLRLEEPPVTTVASVLSALSPISVAWAHPGHDYPGDVAGELLGTFTVDLLADDQLLGVAGCYDGDLATGRVTVLGTTLAGVYGDLPFRFDVPANEDIIGIPLETTLLAEDPPSAIEVRFDAGKALAFVDWTAEDTDGDGTLTVADGTYANTTLFGVVATPTWSLAVIP